MYRAPVEEISHTLKMVTGLNEDLSAGHLGDLSEDLIDAVLSEAGRFAGDEIAPLYGVGDNPGAQMLDGVITMPKGWKKLYHDWIGGGWNSICGPEEFGGQNLPVSLASAVQEMWNSASMSFAIGPTLTLGTIDALKEHGSKELQTKYLEKIVSGEWMGTMNLTEPQAGSDLNALRARAVAQDDGTYRIFGQKIFITYGDHDLTDNIVHMVLARLPDAPAGTRGISLFLVPKFLVNDDGSLGARNDVFCHSMEHKLGIHGSPTCTMIYGDGKYSDEPGAIGWLVGEENRGLACMFTMMNNARLAVGMQGIGVGEAAYQKALNYAHDRTQGKSPDYSGEGMAPIVYHRDVQRNLLTMKSLIQAARSINYCCAYALDKAKLGANQQYWQERAGLLTPIAKAFATDIGVETASIGLQIHGGMGYIEETGAAALLRDSRIAPIYEGTNGIQAIDLVTRKLPQSGGAHVLGYCDELRQMIHPLKSSHDDGFGLSAQLISNALNDFEEATKALLEMLTAGQMQQALAGATPYLRLFALASGGAYLAKSATAGEGEANQPRVALCRFYAENLIGETTSLKNVVIAGSDSLTAAANALLLAPR